MKKHDRVKATHKATGSVIVGTFWGDDGTPSDPPMRIELRVEGMNPETLNLKALEWELERTLPTTYGSLIETKVGLLVLTNKGWINVDDWSTAIPEDTIIKNDFIVHFDCAMMLPRMPR